MIVQTIEISMSKGRAADILAHVGEEGREIEFIPDVELSADDHTAEIDTVKPDGTFTMTNCSIDADGHIIAPITLQAVAVKGLCHYIIKIYNDDIVIYSACGSLWVDDHLITDDMIESVAEVNGYRFPRDFATLDDIPGADEFIDDNAVVTDKTWSSDKISTELNNLKDIYSTSEKIVGKWIDGRPVYEKTFSFDVTSANPQILDAGINSNNAEMIPDTNISFYCGNGWDAWYNVYMSTTQFGRVTIASNGIRFDMTGYIGAMRTIKAYARVRYVKASDL